MTHGDDKVKEQAAAPTSPSVGAKGASSKNGTSKNGGRSPMSVTHKQALAEGRESSRHVRAYIDALEKNRPKRGRKLDRDAVKKRIELIDENLKTAGGFERLNLLVDKQALLGKLDGADATIDLSDLRAKFIVHAKAYGERRNITYATWRSVGVPAADLKAAGIPPGRR